jgi:hypothetical protein
MPKLKIIPLVILMLISECYATGWNDYKLDIGDGYSIVRFASRDIRLSYNHNSVKGFEDTGPVVGYAVNNKYIFCKNHENKDSHKEIFFIVDKENKETIGILTKSEFELHPEVKNYLPISWKIPTNPNFWNPILGKLAIIIFALIILPIKHFWISIPVFAGILFLIFRRKNRNNRKNVA